MSNHHCGSLGKEWGSINSVCVTCCVVYTVFTYGVVSSPVVLENSVPEEDNTQGVHKVLSSALQTRGCLTDSQDA